MDQNMKMSSDATEREYYEHLTEEEKEKYRNMTPEQKRRVLTENKLEYQESVTWEENAGMNQLTDRIEGHSFQG